MRRKLVRARLAALAVSVACLMAAQTPAPSPASDPSPAKPQFFAGTLTEMTAQQITVSRTPVGRPAEKRVFLVTPQTKLSQAAKLKARVTVRYQHLAESDVALEVEVQPRQRAPKTP